MPTLTLPGLETLDWAIIAAFFAVTLGIGLYFSRRAKSSLADYFVAGRKMTWWVAGTSIVATSFAADTPLVFAGWSRTLGLERHWFWWGGVSGMMLCTFFFARLWRRANLLTDVEFTELRYSGAPAAGLRMFHALYRSIIANTLVMGWVTLAMVKILEVTLDIPSLVFVHGQWLPEFLPKGVELASVIDPATILNIPVYGAAIISAKATGIIVCFGVAAGYSTVSGLWGVMATDVFQFCLAMTGTIILMFIVFAVVDGPRNMVDKATDAVNSGIVHNKAPIDRQALSRNKLLEALDDDTDMLDQMIQTGLFQTDNPDKAGNDGAGLLWTANGLNEQQIQGQFEGFGLDDQTVERLVALWEYAYTIERKSFTYYDVVDQLLEASVLIQDESDEDLPLEYLRFPDISITEQALLADLDAAGVVDKSETMAAWRHDKVAPSFKVTHFLPPFDLRGGALLAVWTLIVFLGIQWWAGGEGGGFLAQRLFSCKNEKHSVLAMLWYNFAMYVLRPWPWIIVGIASLFLVPDVTAYGAHYDQEHAYVIMLMKYLPTGLKGLLVAALMAAYMSTISTHVNFGASYIVNDIYKRFISRRGSERSYVLVSQIATIALAVLAGVCAFYMESIGGAWLTYFKWMAGVGVVVLLRWYWWRVNAYAEIAAMAASLGLNYLIAYTECFQYIFGLLGLPQNLVGEYAVDYTIILLLSTVFWFVVMLLTPPEPEDHLIRFYDRIRPPGGWKKIAAAAGHPNHQTVGWIEWASWALGVTGLFSMIFSLGHACFGHYAYAAAFGAYGILATVLIFKLIAKMDWSSITDDNPITNPN